MSKTAFLFSPFLFFIAILIIACCSKKDNERPTTDVPLVILDTDIGSSANDLFALEMLYRYQEQVIADIDWTDPLHPRFIGPLPLPEARHPSVGSLHAGENQDVQQN